MAHQLLGVLPVVRVKLLEVSCLYSPIRATEFLSRSEDVNKPHSAEKYEFWLNILFQFSFFW
jgi:hypothetical protein